MENGLPDDFDINSNITTLRQQLGRTPLSMYFHNLVMRMENKKARKAGRMLFVCHMSL